MGRTVVQEQTLYNAVTFRRLLDSMARPGKINQLEYPNFLLQCPIMSVNLYALGAMLTLLDREVTFAVAADGQWLPHTSPLVQWLVLRSGSTVTTPESAMFAYFGQGRSDGLITQLSRGTQLEPEASATAFYCVEQLTDTNLRYDGQFSKRGSLSWIGAARVRLLPQGQDQQLHRQVQQLHTGWYEEAERLEEDLDWVTLELTGPGIERIHKVGVLGLTRSEITLINLARQGYPLGIDVYLIDALGRCVGLPRTTHIHMVAKEH